MVVNHGDGGIVEVNSEAKVVMACVAILNNEELIEMVQRRRILQDEQLTF